MLDYLGGPSVIKKILTSETGRQENQSQNDTTLEKKKKRIYWPLLILKMTTNQGMQALLEVKKKKKKDLPQNLHQGKQPFSDTLALTQ